MEKKIHVTVAIDKDNLMRNVISIPIEMFATLTKQAANDAEQLLREMGLITGECNCKHCVAERAAMDAQEGDELVNAFIRGFNFKATEGESTRVNQISLSGEALFEIQVKNSKWEDLPTFARESWNRIAVDINKFFGVN